MKDIGKRIREIRKRKKISMQVLANEIGVAVQTIQKYETGIIKDIPLKQLKKIAQVLEVSLFDFLDNKTQDKFKNSFNESNNSIIKEMIARNKQAQYFGIKTDNKSELITELIAIINDNNVNIDNLEKIELLKDCFKILVTLNINNLEKARDFLDYLQIREYQK